MILLDTTVLVYAVGSDHPLQAPCRGIIEAVAQGRLAATATVETIQEFAHVRARRMDRTDAASLASNFTRLLAPLVVVDDDDLRAGLDLWRTSEQVGAFDAVLAATVMRRPHLSALVSADRGFGSVSGLRWLAPYEVEIPQ